MHLKEWHRTIILSLLIVIAIGYIIYLKTGYETQIEDILR